MTKTIFVKRHRWVMVVLLLAVVVTGGIFMFSLNEKSKEERRNREYEVSLVGTLKNTYEGIEEIQITNPNYTNPPGSWTCVINLHFENKVIKYKINYSKQDKRISDISLERENRVSDREFLNSHFGETNRAIKVRYSDGSERLQ